jgi:catechol 2,3-dioxygenase-like lactoylglutathione lyase family enzyme
MIDHLTLRVRDYEASKAFYTKVLAPLGYEVLMEFEMPEVGKFSGFGVKPKPDFWLASHSNEHPAGTGQHIAFLAKTRAQVDAFHKAALAAGAKDDGKPGPRVEYHPDYYGAFVIDLNGVHLEACSHHAE